MSKDMFDSQYDEPRVTCASCSANQPESWMVMESGDGERWYRCSKCQQGDYEDYLASLAEDAARKAKPEPDEPG